MRRSIRKFNIPPPGATPRAFELLKIGLLLPQYSLMFLSTSINVLFTHDPTSYVAFLPHLSK